MSSRPSVVGDDPIIDMDPYDITTRLDVRGPGIPFDGSEGRIAGVGHVSIIGLGMDRDVDATATM